MIILCESTKGIPYGIQWHVMTFVNPYLVFEKLDLHQKVMNKLKTIFFLSYLFIETYLNSLKLTKKLSTMEIQIAKQIIQANSNIAYIERSKFT